MIRGPEGAFIAAADPITVTSRDVGELGVIINANDVAVMGVDRVCFLQ
ncbi:MAG TPA: hypothetical protein VE569_14580 [Acidimicrobiia bacterium]|nr:hypothetical protein [Acidimicrobiia bacterium]